MTPPPLLPAPRLQLLPSVSLVRLSGPNRRTLDPNRPFTRDPDPGSPLPQGGMERDVELQQPLVVQSQPAGAPEPGQWSTGLCDCCSDVGDCCFALWCLPVFVCKTTGAVGACPCLPLLDCVGCVPSASLAMRATVRARYGIKGNVWSDCFYGCCCYALSWCQISREMKRRALLP
ncbi:hypothetical protein ANANG_G00072050 [Anguilla anguilla]|uniref:Uncharacterized protein n=1 Tax=Anguilla anguilla TaxID=7936 RepID=A0A9D3MU09_ANGAN|nr:hypothetical protein ANANG_G00072050 [Anguilla anguilla]